jgi:hypothetical protein
MWCEGVAYIKLAGTIIHCGAFVNMLMSVRGNPVLSKSRHYYPTTRV